jgi:hypothetical protein
MAEHLRIASIVGSTFYPGAGNLIGRLRNGSPLILRRQPENKYDKNAIAINWGNRIIGHVPRGLAAELAPLMDAGTEIKVMKHGQAWGVVRLDWRTWETANAESNT